MKFLSLSELSSWERFLGSPDIVVWPDNDEMYVSA